MKVKLYKTEVNYILEDDKGVVIASTSLKKEGLALSIKNCQAIENAYDLDDSLSNFQSLQQTEWNVEVEKENVMHDYNGNISFGAKFKLDADGCLILKLKSE